MALGFSSTLRQNMLDEITALIDADAGAGEIRVYSGTRPATGGALSGNTLLATLVFSTTSFPAASSNAITSSAITDESSATAGTASWFRVVDNSGDFVMDGDVGTSGSDLNLNTVTIGAGVTVSVSLGGFVINAGNA